jgi:hypothetical protein
MTVSTTQRLTLKKQVLEQVIEAVRQEKTALTQSAKAAHLAATHEESRAEDKHDTFAIEASYLAAGQAARVQALNLTEEYFVTALENIQAQPTITPICLFELKAGQLARSQIQLLALQGGGTHLQIDSLGSVQIITPQSPLGDQALGLRAGDTLELETPHEIREFTVNWVI